MKKKLTLVIVAVVLVAAIAIGGSLAYFTSTDAETNTFTAGNVKIDLIEREANLTSDFVDGKTLVPGTQTVNAVAKRAWIANEGTNDAYVWAEILIPQALIDDENNKLTIGEGYDETYNSLHYNNYGQFTVGFYNPAWPASGYAQTPITDGVVDADTKAPTVTNMVAVADGLWRDFVYQGTETIEGVPYYVFRTVMDNKLPAGQVSLPFLRQVYMDWRIDQGTIEGYKLMSGVDNYTDTWDVVVKAYAIQAEGFETVDAAIAAYYAQ